MPVSPRSLGCDFSIERGQTARPGGGVTFQTNAGSDAPDFHTRVSASGGLGFIPSEDGSREDTF